MTGGQMAPTTLIGQKATTCPLGCTKEQAGMPIRMSEMLSTLDGCVYAERVCVTDIANLNKAKKAIKKAFQLQMEGKGFTFVEVLSTCPTNWGMTTEIHRLAEGEHDPLLSPRRRQGYQRGGEIR